MILTIFSSELVVDIFFLTINFVNLLDTSQENFRNFYFRSNCSIFWNQLIYTYVSKSILDANFLQEELIVFLERVLYYYIPNQYKILEYSWDPKFNEI